MTCNAGHVLSFLPADEAARAAALSRRYRHVFAHVHTISLDEPETQPDSDDDSDYGCCYSPGYGPCPNVKLVPPFVNRVSAAILGRLRLGGGAAGVPLRALRVGFDEFSGRLNAGLVDMWLCYAVQQAGDEFHLDLRRPLPHLATLTLEACAKLTALSVPDARLRTLALRCCHDLAFVVVTDASELRAFEYRGAVPAGPSFLTLHGGPLTVSSCTLDFCGEEAMDPLHLAGLGDMLQLFVGVERLQLTSARLGCGAAALLPSAFPAFAKLRHLELTGILPEDDDTAIDAVARILERTPNLETLTLFFMPEPEPEPKNKHYGHHGEELHMGICSSTTSTRHSSCWPLSSLA
ncbi:unnamed protein product [Miscanthus lutarioriparius]|uniref:Uncharacterized protein n=1 Tax=Miscanthus lutarioriparius TaxID=422564 RepID=A0A811QA29_9POAL|nr:unnamed protein product [Miscanthus lutarioriparius]